MPRWKELPSSLDERVRQLIIQLRRLKDRSGLSFVSLESKTGYSRTSWDRYLNGKSLPPRQAVEALARVAGVEPTRLLVLHEVAEQVWKERASQPSPAEANDRDEESRPGSEAAAGTPGTADALADPPDGPGPRGERAAGSPRPSRPAGVSRPVALAAVIAAALVGLGTGMLIAAPPARHDGGDGGAQTAVGGPRPGTTPAVEGPGPYVYKLGKSYPCKVRRTPAKGGGLSAGYSTTRTAVLASPGWDVVEAQCLLIEHTVDPGIVDGVYGQQTRAAVARLQTEAGLPVDGVVGPDTWRVLRK